MLAAIYCTASYTGLDAWEELSYFKVDLHLAQEMSQLIEIGIWLCHPPTSA